MWKRQNPMHTPRVYSCVFVMVLLLLFLLLFGNYSVAQEKGSHFASPEAAMRVLVDAISRHDIDALLGIVGQDFKDLVVSGDDQADQEARREFIEASEQLLRLESEGDSDDRQVMIVGEQEWPFPIPLVREAQGWRFDIEAGAEEILNRRIGRNELEAIAMLQALVTAQLDYASEDRDGDQVLEYAQRIKSSEGQRDGLFWKVDEASGEDLSPIGPYLSAAADYLEDKKAGDPWYGYYFKVLTGQGENAPGGAHSYIINDNMIAGFAFLAFPAEYGKSGVMTLSVSHQGVIYEKDLGDDTLEAVKGITVYDPDESWRAADDDDR